MPQASVGQVENLEDLICDLQFVQETLGLLAVGKYTLLKKSTQRLVMS